MLFLVQREDYSYKSTKGLEAGEVPGGGVEFGVSIGVFGLFSVTEFVVMRASGRGWS